MPARRAKATIAVPPSQQSSLAGVTTPSSAPALDTRLTAKKRIRKDPNRHLYTDRALADVTDGETELLELFTHSNDARHAVEHARKVAQLTGAHAPERAKAV